MLALDDGAIARILIGATRHERDSERCALLRRFAYLAERRPPSYQRAPNGAPENRPRSPGVREHMRRYRARLKHGIAIVPVPIDGAIVAYLVREGLLRRDKEAHARDEIGRAIAAVLGRLAR